MKILDKHLTTPCKSVQKHSRDNPLLNSLIHNFNIYSWAAIHRMLEMLSIGFWNMSDHNVKFFTYIVPSHVELITEMGGRRHVMHFSQKAKIFVLPLPSLFRSKSCRYLSTVTWLSVMWRIRGVDHVMCSAGTKIKG